MSDSTSLSDKLVSEAAASPIVKAADLARAVVQLRNLKARGAQMKAQNDAQIDRQLTALNTAMASDDAKTVLAENYAALLAEVKAL